MVARSGRIKRWLALTATAGWFWGGISCVSAEKNQVFSDGQREKLRYELRPHKPVTAPDPLPTRTDYQVTWIYRDGYQESYVGIRAWDFNDDGRYEMVEELNATGGLVRRRFDFDGDGEEDTLVPMAKAAQKKEWKGSPENGN